MGTDKNSLFQRVLHSGLTRVLASGLFLGGMVYQRTLSDEIFELGDHLGFNKTPPNSLLHHNPGAAAFVYDSMNKCIDLYESHPVDRDKLTTEWKESGQAICAIYRGSFIAGNEDDKAFKYIIFDKENGPLAGYDGEGKITGRYFDFYPLDAQFKNYVVVDIDASPDEYNTGATINMASAGRGVDTILLDKRGDVVEWSHIPPENERARCDESLEINPCFVPHRDMSRYDYPKEFRNAVRDTQKLIQRGRQELRLSR